MNPLLDPRLLINRRQFFGRVGIGATALAALLNEESCASTAKDAAAMGGLPGLPHFVPKAKRVIYLFQSGAPSQMDLFDHKPRLAELHGTELPDTVRKGQRITGMTSGQGKLPVAASAFRFAQHGKSGAWLSELLPHTARVA